MHDTDVVVIGAGPAGATAAREIARNGYGVFLVEKSAFPGQTSVCGGGIDKVSVENLDLPEKVIEKNISKSLHYFPWGIYTLTTPSLSVQRNVFDRFLAERAEKYGAKLFTSTIAWNVTLKRNAIVAHLRNLLTNESYEVKAKLLIFADGPHTLASRKFRDVGFRSKPSNTAFAAIYEIEWKHNPFDCFEYFFDTKISPWGYGWIFPKKNLLNVGVVSLMSKMRSNIRKHLDFLVDKHPIASKKLHERPKLRFAADIIPLQHARRIYGERILVVGDAAGMVDPLWGGGISYAIRGSSIAARVAVKALEKSKFNEAFLSRFQRTWKKDKSFKYLRRQQLLSRLFLIYSKFDRNAYIRLQTMLLWISRARKSKLTNSMND
jgi:digeranylgeranylglycerophospholipid reductase